MKPYEGEIVHQVFLAIEGEGKMVVGQKVSLEMLSRDDDGIFKTNEAGAAFCMATSALATGLTTSTGSLAKTC